MSVSNLLRAVVARLRLGFERVEKATKRLHAWTHGVEARGEGRLGLSGGNHDRDVPASITPVNRTVARSVVSLRCRAIRDKISHLIYTLAGPRCALVTSRT